MVAAIKEFACPLQCWTTVTVNNRRWKSSRDSVAAELNWHRADSYWTVSILFCMSCSDIWPEFRLQSHVFSAVILTSNIMHSMPCQLLDVKHSVCYGLLHSFFLIDIAILHLISQYDTKITLGNKTCICMNPPFRFLYRSSAMSLLGQ